MKNLFDNEEIVTKRENANSLPLSLNPDIQDKLDSLPVENSYQNELETRHDVGPYKIDLKKPAPSFTETLVHSMPFWSHLADSPDLNPLSDATPPGWNAASDESYFTGLDEKYHGRIAAATSPNDAFFKKLEALRKQDEEESFANGSMLAKFAGGFVDTLPFLLIPLGQSVAYAKLSDTVFQAALSSFPGIASSSLLYEGSVQAQEIGGNLHDTILNSYIDTIAGLAFIGGGAGIAKGFESMKLYNAKDAMKLHYNGIDPMIVIDEHGKVDGFMAVPRPGMNVGAAEVDDAQAFLDSSFAMNGLFAIPKIGGLMGKTIALANPVFRGLTSPFETVRGFADRSASHGLITEGILAGRAKPEDFETLMGIVMADNKLYYGQMQTLLDRRNDINNKSSIINLAERTRKKWKDEGYIDAEKFGNEVKQSIFSGNSSEHAAVNEAAALTRQYLDETWELYRQVYNLPKDWMPPPTSDGYFPRVYNIGLMMERPQEWQNMWVGWWKQADQEINTAMKPLNEFRETLKAMKVAHAELQSNANATEEQIKESSNGLKAAQRKMRKLNEDLADRIKQDKSLFLHGEDHAGLSGKESRALKKLLKPVRINAKRLKLQRAVVEKLNQQKFFLENKIQQASKKETIAKLKKELQTLEADIAVQKKGVEDIKIVHDTEVEKLQEMASEGKISPRLYTEVPDSQRVAFKSPSNLMKFRKTFESEFHMQQHADALRDTILNQTPEDTLSQVLGHYIGTVSESPTLKRTQMIPDQILQTNNFLSNNLPLIVSNYRNNLHRKISMKMVYGDVTIDGGIRPMIKRLAREFKNKETALINNKALKDDERAKDIKKLNEQFKEAKEYMNLTYNRMMGRNRGSRKMNQFTRFARLWTVSTRLGSVPLSMTTDITANIYKHGLWPSIRDGLMPAMENIAHQMKTGKGTAYIENAPHAHLGLETVLAANNDRDWGGIAMEHVPLSGTLGNFMEHAAHMSGNIALTNQATNSLQRVAASIIQSKVIRYLMAHQEGKLKEKDLQKLLVYGLDPKEWGERMLKSYKAHGYEGTVKGSHQSQYWKWDDVEAANKMSRTIYKGVQDTIIRKGMMTAPFFFDDPIWGTIFFFHGWSTAALTRYLVPLMQRPDAEHLTGLVWMLMAGSLVSPMRRISKGESPVDDESNMFKDALTDSGILTPIMSLIEDANILTNGRILHGLVNDRWRQRSIAGSLGGPVLGVGDDVTKILGMLVTGRINETDVKKAGHLIPTMQPWYLKGLMNKGIEGLGLPKTAAEYDNNSANAYR